MKLKSVLALGTIAFVAAAWSPSGQAESLATKHRHAMPMAGNVPHRGMTMAQVQKRFGAPVEKLPTAGGDAPRHPPINRWRYNGYTVYFERNRVIHSVLDSAPTS